MVERAKTKRLNVYPRWVCYVESKLESSGKKTPSVGANRRWLIRFIKYRICWKSRISLNTCDQSKGLLFPMKAIQKYLKFDPDLRIKQ